jgi:hypothetical protein
MQKAHRDISDIQSLCAATGNRLPPFQGKDLSGKLCNQKKLENEIKKTQ